MKTNFLILITCAALAGYACNNTPSGNINQTNTIADTLAKPAASVADDPDPTDSIPGNLYGINSSSKTTAALVRSTLLAHFKTDLDKNIIDSSSRKFIFFEYDLDDNGNKEILVGLRGPYFCGSGGCTQYLLNHEGQIICKFTVSEYPIVIDQKRTNGWKDLLLESGGKLHIMKFDGKKYPSNPTLQPVLNELPGDGLPRALHFLAEPYPWFSF